MRQIAKEKADGTFVIHPPAEPKVEAPLPVTMTPGAKRALITFAVVAGLFVTAAYVTAGLIFFGKLN